jgi:ubiquinone/menaquinone biosynthesis C-methylase UbiE
MEPRLQRRVQRYGWDRAAPHYDQCWRDALAPATERLIGLASLRPGERVLDVACGTGALALAAARCVGRQGSVLGTDISQNMVEAAGAMARAMELANCRFERCDAEALSEDGPRFDAALCGLGLMYMPDPERALELMFRNLLPGGRLAASVWGRRDRCGWAGVFPIIDARVESEVCPLFFRLGTGEALAGALRGAGAQGVRTERLQVVLSYRCADEACDAALLGGPVALAYGRFDDATKAAVRQEYLESIAAFRRGAAYEIPGEFVIGCGLR